MRECLAHSLYPSIHSSRVKEKFAVPPRRGLFGPPLTYPSLHLCCIRYPLFRHVGGAHTAALPRQLRRGQDRSERKKSGLFGIVRQLTTLSAP